MPKNKILALVYGGAVALLFLRIDLWWWGKKIQPILFGWITLPMLYQLFIWAAGVALVYVVCLKVWDIEQPKKDGEQS